MRITVLNELLGRLQRVRGLAGAASGCSVAYASALSLVKHCLFTNGDLCSQLVSGELVYSLLPVVLGL